MAEQKLSPFWEAEHLGVCPVLTGTAGMELLLPDLGIFSSGDQGGQAGCGHP